MVAADHFYTNYTEDQLRKTIQSLPPDICMAPVAVS